MTKIQQSSDGTETFYVIFDGPPGPESGRFVEVEDSSGRGAGGFQWLQQSNGLWALGPFKRVDESDKNICHSCARPTTEDESVVVRPGERVCIACIKAGKVTNPEPEQDESDEGGMWPADWTETR